MSQGRCASSRQGTRHVGVNGLRCDGVSETWRSKRCVCLSANKVSEDVDEP